MTASPCQGACEGDYLVIHCVYGPDDASLIGYTAHPTKTNHSNMMAPMIKVILQIHYAKSITLSSRQTDVVSWLNKCVPRPAPVLADSFRSV